jgi:hypothetical protein
MVLEWLEGRSLGDELEERRSRRLRGRAWGDTLALLDPAVDALAYAHAQGVVHRDLNPGNLFLAKTREGTRLKVLDFGVAKIVSDHALALGPRAQTIGQIRIFSPAYASPEQFDDNVGPIGPASDVYALALVLLEVLRDEPVNEGEHVGEFAMRTLDPSVRPTPTLLGLVVGDKVESLMASAVALRPGDRPQDAGEFWGMLKHALRADAESGRPLRAKAGTLVMAQGSRGSSGPPNPHGPTLVDQRNLTAGTAQTPAEPVHGVATPMVVADTRKVWGQPAPIAMASQPPGEIPKSRGPLIVVLLLAGVLVLVGLVAAVWWAVSHRAGSTTLAEPAPDSSSLEPVASASTPEPTPSVPEAPDAGVPDAAPPRVADAGPKPAVVPTATVPSATAFDPVAAQAALSQIDGILASCKASGGPTGIGYVTVTFGNDGQATSAVVSRPPFGGTPVGLCVESRFRMARMKKTFEGAPRGVSHQFFIPN